MEVIAVPNLDLYGMLDEGIKFYARIGIVTGLYANIETAQYELFEKSCGMPREQAATIFFTVKSDDARLQMADAAAKFFLAGKPQLKTWEQLHDRIQGDARRYRNLMSHNPVQWEAPAPPTYRAVTLSEFPVGRVVATVEEKLLPCPQSTQCNKIPLPEPMAANPI